MTRVLAVAACAVVASSVWADPTVPPGFVVDQLLGQPIDGVTPRIEAIRQPAFGSGMVGASIANGVLTVMRISLGEIDALATIGGIPANSFVLDIRFAPAELFGGDLFVSVLEPTGNPNLTITRFWRIGSNGSVVSMGPYGGGAGNDSLAFYLEFTGAASGYGAGAMLVDLAGDPNDPLGGSSLWFLDAGGTASRLAQHSVPAGRSDIDVRSIELDRTGAFGSNLLLADTDANNDHFCLVYRLSPGLVWTAVNANVHTNTRYYRDMALSPGGLLGAFAYLSEARADTIERLAPDGTSTTFASGFNFSTQSDNEPGGSASLTIDDTGNIMYVADDSGIYRIRATGDEPGPVVIATTPSVPGASVLTGAAVASFRVVFNEPVSFTDADVTITNGAGNPVGFHATGSGSQFMLIGLVTPLKNDTYTVTLADSLKSVASAQPLDGDNNGIAGGDAVLSFKHFCRADFTNDRLLDFFDLQGFLSQFAAGCP